MTALSIALDVMGGDRAPDSTLQGALDACAPDGVHRIDPERIVLVGDEELVRAKLEALGGNPGFGLRHAGEVIGMAESPAVALRSKPDNSISVSVGLVKAGAVGAMVSMGNTGAVVGAATLGLGALEGVKRPALAVTLELTGHPVTLLDMGANTAPKPEQLAHNALMGSVYQRDCLGIEAPRVGLLNVGEEPSKGTELMKAAYPLLEAAPVEFLGNIESSDLFTGKVDVVVTDGFTGNVVLKLLESFSVFMLELLLGELQAHEVKWAPEALQRIRQKIDYSAYGGALLLGVQGIVVKGHGRSDSEAVANALGLAARALDAEVNAHIVAGLAGAAAGPE